MSCRWIPERGQFLMCCWPLGRRGKYIRLWLPKGIDTQAKADEFEQLYKKSFRSADPFHQSRPRDLTIRAMWKEYYQYISTNKAKTTAADVEITGRHIARHIGDFIVTDVNTNVFELYKRLRLEEFVPSQRKETSKLKTQAKPRKISHRTVNKELVWLSGMLTYYREVVKLPGIPRVEWKRLPHARPIPVVLSKPEIIALLSAAEPPFFRAMFGLMVLCGLRLEEVRGLRWANVDAPNKRIIVYGKGGKYRTIPVRDWLIDLILAIPEAGEYVFTNPKTHKQIVNIMTPLRRTAKAAKIIKRIYPHLLRHTYATHAVSEISLRELQWLLGHSQVETTTFYTHVNDENLTAAAGKVLAGIEVPSLPKANGTVSSKTEESDRSLTIPRKR